MGVLDERTALTGALSDFHIIIWKFLVIDMVKVDTEGAKFEVSKVWQSASQRLRSRVDSAIVAVERKVDSAMRLERNPPPLEADNRAWEPLLFFEYTDHYTVTTHLSTPYLELVGGDR